MDYIQYKGNVIFKMGKYVGEFEHGIFFYKIYLSLFDGMEEL